MRALCFVLLLGGAVACADQGPCGLDGEGNEIPSCAVDGAPNEGLYCPSQHWGSDDGCNSCGCSPDGSIVCTENTCG